MSNHGNHADVMGREYPTSVQERFIIFHTGSRKLLIHKAITFGLVIAKCKWLTKE